MRARARARVYPLRWAGDASPRTRSREREREKGERERNKERGKIEPFAFCKRRVTKTLGTHFFTIALSPLSFIVFVFYPLHLVGDASPGPGVELVLVQKI